MNAFFWSFIWVWKRWSNYIFNMKSYCASLKCTSVNAFIPQWNFKRMHSILRCFFLYHRSFLFFVIYVIWINYMCNILKASILGMTEDKFEYTKRVIRNLKSWKTDSTMAKSKRTNNDLQNITQKNEQHKAYTMSFLV